MTSRRDIEDAVERQDEMLSYIDLAASNVSMAHERLECAIKTLRYQRKYRKPE
jgi:hypothetical protein